MAFEMSNPEEVMNEPLEQESANGPVEEGPGEDLLAELGAEVLRSQGEPPKEEVQADSGDEVEAEPEAETEEEKVEAETKQEEPKGRAQKRIQALANEKKELEARLAQRDAEFQRQMQMVQQQQAAQAQALARQNAVLQKQLELLDKRSQPVEDESALTPMERYERELLKKAEILAEQKLSPKIKAMEDRLAKQDAEKAAAIQHARQQRSLQEYTARAQAASKEVLMSDVDVGGFTPEDDSIASDLVLSYIAATGAEPQEAAQRFKVWLDKYHQGRLKNVSKTSGRKIQQSQRVPAPLQQSKTSVQGEALPSLAELHAHGFDNHVQWMGRGSPHLSKK